LQAKNEKIELKIAPPKIRKKGQKSIKFQNITKEQLKWKCFILSVLL